MSRDDRRNALFALLTSKTRNIWCVAAAVYPASLPCPHTLPCQAGVSRRTKSSQRAAVSTEQVPSDTLDEPQSFPPQLAGRMTSFLRGAALGADCAGLDPNAQRPDAEAEVLGAPRGEAVRSAGLHRDMTSGVPAVVR